MKKYVSFFLLACCTCLPDMLMAQRIKGSDTVLPLTQELSEMYMKKNPSATVTVTGGGSGVGISALLDGTTDLAMASRKIKFSEKMKMKQAKHEPCEYIVAYDALAVIVNPQNPVKQLTREQLEDIFRGKITNWKEVGGEDARIVVYSRETSSGTYEFFKESVLHNKNYMSSVLSMPATGAIIQSCRILRPRQTLCLPFGRKRNPERIPHCPSVVLLLRQIKRKERHAFPQLYHFRRRTSQDIRLGIHSPLIVTHNIGIYNKVYRI